LRGNITVRNPDAQSDSAVGVDPTGNTTRKSPDSISEHQLQWKQCSTVLQRIAADLDSLHLPGVTKFGHMRSLYKVVPSE
jgi:hypothetical protein